MSQKVKTIRQDESYPSAQPLWIPTITIWPESEMPNHTQARIDNYSFKEYIIRKELTIYVFHSNLYMTNEDRLTPMEDQ